MEFLDSRVLLSAAENLGIEINDGQLEKLEIYARLLCQWNEKMNLTAITSPEGIALLHFADSLKYTTESGRVVYGGGGIMPDIFVPVDTTDMTPYFREVAGRSILYKFTLEFSDRYRGQLNKIRSLEELDRFFDRQPNLLNEFVSYAAKAGVAPKPAEIERSKAILLAQLKAYIGRNTELEDNAFYHEIQGIDNVIARSIEVLDSAGHAGS